MSSADGRKISDTRPLIVSAVFDAGAQGWLEGLRRAHYPPERNLVPAHLTLFHGLPGSALAEVSRRLARAAGDFAAMPAEFRGWEMRDSGGYFAVAMRVECRALEGLRDELAEALWLVMGAQDRAGARLHVTVQNKVGRVAARATLAALAREAMPVAPRVAGLRLWHYAGGPWETAGAWSFRGLSRGGGLR